MEYDFETGSEDEVILREAQKIHNRLPQGGLYNAITPLVRVILALLAALGARTVREALERINAMLPRVNNVEGEVTRLVEGITAAAEAPAIAVRTWITPLVEDRARLQRECASADTVIVKLTAEVAAGEKIAQDYRAQRDEARREVETKRQHVVSMVESYDRMREQLGAASAEIARLKAAALTEGEARAAIIAANNALAEVCHGDYEHQIECHTGTLPDMYRCLAKAADRALDALSPIVLDIVDPDARGDIPPEVRPACDECGATATKTGTTGTFCDAHADACSRVIEAADCASDPAHVSPPGAGAAIETFTVPEREAYRRGVERGRYEALERPGGLVLVLEDGLRPAERARVAEFCRTVRGVAAALPVANVTTIRRLARVSAELISARAANERSRRDVDRLTKLARALHRQRKDATDSVSPADPPPDCEGCHELVSECVCDAGRRSRGENPFGAALARVHKQTPTEAERFAREAAERLCVAVLVTDPENRVALIESAKPGRAWELPGGKVELDETPRAAAVREVAEEMGVQLAEDALEPAGIVHGTPKPGAQFASVIHVFRALGEGELRPGSDAKGARWWTAAQVLVAKDLSDLDARDVLLAWAREQGGIQ